MAYVGGGGGTPPGTPVAAASPAALTDPIPGAALYGQAALGANTAYNNTLARINLSRTNLLRQYGYAGDIDPVTGEIKNMHVDPNNPNGQLQQLFKNTGVNMRQANDAAAARGFTGPGLGAVGATEAHAQGDLGEFGLGNALTGSINDLIQQQTDAAANRDAALYQAAHTAAQDAINAANFTPVAAPNVPDYGQGPETPAAGTETPAAGTITAPSPLNAAAIALRANNGPGPTPHAPRRRVNPATAAVIARGRQMGKVLMNQKKKKGGR